MNESNSQDFSDDLLHTFDGMISGRDPRIVALIPAAFLERHVQALILVKLPDLRSKLRDKLFGTEGAISSLGAKIDIAEALGAISQGLAQRTLLVARIRNRFAHRIDIRDFDHPEVSKLVEELDKLNQAGKPQISHGGEWHPLTKENNEGRFVAAASSVCNAVAASLLGSDFDIRIERPDMAGAYRTIHIRRALKSEEL